MVQPASLDGHSREQLLEEVRLLHVQVEKERLEHADRLQQVRREAGAELRELQQTIVRLREEMEAMDWERKQALQKTASESRAEILQLQSTIRELRTLLESNHTSAIAPASGPKT